MPHNIEKALVDVTHPQPGEDSSPLIAAVAASIDWPQVAKYKGLVSAQPHRQEIIQGLYTTYNDPKRGIIHGGLIRAGVGEGQFKEVLLNEMEEIQKACISLENYMPPVTFIVFQKRQHAHFFPVRHGDIASTDRSGKIRPGTVVDTKICHPTAFDVYLCMLVAPKLSPLAHPLLSELGLARREISFSDSRFQCATLDHVAEVHSFPVIHDNVKSVMIY